MDFRGLCVRWALKGVSTGQQGSVAKFENQTSPL